MDPHARDGNEPNAAVILRSIAFQDLDAQAIAQALEGIPQEWWQPGNRPLPGAEQHFRSYLLNNIQHHPDLVMRLSDDERRASSCYKICRARR